MNRRTVLIGALLVLAVVQVEFGWDGLADWSGPVVGNRPPDVPLSLVTGAGSTNLRTLTAQTKGCDVVFLISTYCPHCARLRYTWTTSFGTWTDSVGTEVGAIWIVHQDTEIAERFVSGFELRGTTVASLAKDVRRSWRQLGAVGTPIAYLIDKAGIVQAGVRGPRFPSARQAQDVCRTG